jgi:hypothetical protein
VKAIHVLFVGSIGTQHILTLQLAVCFKLSCTCKSLFVSHDLIGKTPTFAEVPDYLSSVHVILVFIDLSESLLNKKIKISVSYFSNDYGFFRQVTNITTQSTVHLL